jgi:hypothetical protein
VGLCMELLICFFCWCSWNLFMCFWHFLLDFSLIFNCELFFKKNNNKSE